MVQSMAMLTQMSAGHASFAQGIPFARPMPLQGIPGFGGTGPLGLAGMAITPQLTQIYNQMGLAPMGINHDQNVYDRLMAQRYSAAQMQAMQQASASDRTGYVQTIRGMAALTGTPWGAEQHRSAQSLSRMIATAAPMLTEMAPDLLDQMGGQRGSATVMAKRMIDAGRYRVDPVTGRMGMSAGTIAFQANDIYKNLYSDQNIAGMKGITAGQLGGMYQELQQRGLISTQASTTGSAGLRLGGYDAGDPRSQTIKAIEEIRRSDPGKLREAAKNVGVDVSKGTAAISGEDLDKLGLDPTVANKMRTFDGTRIKQSLKSYIGAVSAMRDIFGDMGRPNAPMSELVAGLEAMTAGSMAQIDPARLGMMARRTYNLSKQTGVTMDNALMMQQHAAQRAQQLGMEPIFAVHAAQGALGFGGAYRAQGHAAHTAWGAFNSDQVQQMDANLRVQAASSNAANRMAVAARLSESVGGFKTGSDADSYVQAVKAGVNQWKDSTGQLRSVVMSDQGFTQLMTGATDSKGQKIGIKQDDVLAMLMQRSTNREYIDKLSITDTVRRAQGRDEIHPYVGHRMQETLTARLRENLVEQGVERKEANIRAEQAGRLVSQRATRRMFEMSTEEFADNTSRSEGIADIIQQELEATGQAGVMQGMDAKQRKRFLKQTADQFYGQANEAMQTSPYREFQNLQNVHRLTNQTTLNEADRQQMQATFRAEMQESMAPLGKGTMLSRAVDAVQHAQPDDPQALLKVVAEAMGGVKMDDISRAMLPQLRKVQDRRAAVEELEGKLLTETNPEQRVQLMGRVQTARKELRAQADELSEHGANLGIYGTDSLQPEQLRRAEKSTRELIDAQNDTAGIRGGFGNEVRAEELKAIRGESTDKLTNNDVASIIVARRQRDVDTLRLYDTGRQQIGKMEYEKAPEAEIKKAKEDLEKIKPSEEQIGRFSMAMTAVRSTPQTRGMSDKQARAMALDYLDANVMNVDKFQISKATQEGTKVEDDQEAMAVARMRRRTLATRASQEEIDDFMKGQPGSTVADAREVLNARLRAKRLGVTEDEVIAKQDELNWQEVNEQIANKPNMAHIAGKHKRWVEAGRPKVWTDKPTNEEYSAAESETYQTAAKPIREKLRTSEVELTAIGAVFADQEDKALGVSFEERDKFLQKFKPTDGQADKFRKENKMEQATPAEVREAMAVKLIVQKKQAQQQERMKEFWSSEEGELTRDKADKAGQDIEDIAYRLIATPKMTERLGMRALEMSDQLRKGQQRLRELAVDYAGGDVARLMENDFTIDRSTKQGVETLERVRSERQAIQVQQRNIIQELEESTGLKGKQFQLGDEDIAANRVFEKEAALRAGDKTKGMSPESIEKSRFSALSPTTRAQVVKRAAEFGTTQRAKEILGITADDGNLTEFQSAQIAGLRYGVGNEEEVIGFFGRDKWEKMTPAEQASKLEAMQKGTTAAGTGYDGALKLLGLTPEQAKSKDAQMKIEAVMVGMSSEAHQRQLVDIAIDADASKFDAPTKRKLAGAKYGIASHDFARIEMKLPEDERSPEVRKKIQDERESMGNRAEAFRIMGQTGKKSLSDADAFKVSRLRQGDMSREEAMDMFSFGKEYDKLEQGDKNKVDMAVRGLGSDEQAAITAGLQQKMYDGKLTDDDKRTIERTKKRIDTDQYAMQALGKKSSEYLTPEQEKDANRIAYDVGIARRLAPDEEKKLQQVKTTEARLKKMADQQGTTVEEMTKVLVKEEKTVDAVKLTTLTPEEQKRRDGAKRQYDQGSWEAVTAENATKNLEVLRKQLGDFDQDTNKNTARKVLDKQIGEAKQALDKANVKKTAAMDEVGTDATGRKVTAKEYLEGNGKGFILDDVKDQFKRVSGEYAKEKEAADAVAKKYGVKLEDTDGAKDVIKKHKQAQQEKMRQENETPAEIVKKIMTRYRTRDDDKGDLSQKEKEIASQMEGTKGRAFGQRVIETFDAVEKVAKRGLGKPGKSKSFEDIDKTTQEYMDAQRAGSRSDKMRDFKKKFGFDSSHGELTDEGRRDFQQFEEALQFQHNRGLLKFGSSRKTGDFQQSQMQYLQAGEMKTTDSKDGDQKRMELHGTVKIDLQGQTADFAGVSGGGRGDRC